MPFDGSGIFLRLYSWIADATAGTKIRADRHDDEDNNFRDGLSNCIAKDGQTTITQNIPFNSKRITALQDPVNAQDAATKHYIDGKFTDDVAFTGDVTIRNDDPTLTLDGKDGFKDSIFGDKGGKHRWEIVLGNATTESGSDAGSDFELVNYHDDGTQIGDVFFGTRSTGLMTVKADPTEDLGIATKKYVDAKTKPENLALPNASFTCSTDSGVPSGVYRPVGLTQVEANNMTPVITGFNTVKLGAGTYIYMGVGKVYSTVGPLTQVAHSIIIVKNGVEINRSNEFTQLLAGQNVNSAQTIVGYVSLNDTDTIQFQMGAAATYPADTTSVTIMGGTLAFLRIGPP